MIFIASVCVCVCVCACFVCPVHYFVWPSSILRSEYVHRGHYGAHQDGQVLSARRRVEWAAKNLIEGVCVCVCVCVCT